MKAGHGRQTTQSIHTGATHTLPVLPQFTPLVQDLPVAHKEACQQCQRPVAEVPAAAHNKSSSTQQQQQQLALQIHMGVLRAEGFQVCQQPLPFGSSHAR